MGDDDADYDDDDDAGGMRGGRGDEDDDDHPRRESGFRVKRKKKVRVLGVFTRRFSNDGRKQEKI